MPYGVLKVDTITFTDGGVDKSVAISGLVQNPTFSGNITATGTISGNIIQGGTTVSGLTVTGTTANFASGVFTTQISGAIVKVPAGTADAPSLQVGTGTSVAPGLYGAGTDQIGISTGGSSVVVLDSVGQLRLINAGTAAAPAVIVGNDLNSGLYSPGADQVALSTAGTGRLFVDASGKIGVGTGSPSRNFVLTGSGVTYLKVTEASLGETAADGFDFIIDSGANAYLWNRENGTLQFATNNTERLRITSDGKVGIGTSTPGTVLHCAINSSATSIAAAPGTAFFQNLNATSGAINNLLFVNSGGFGSAAIYTTQTQAGNSGDNLVFTTKTSGGSWNTGVVIDTSGRLLVGTSTARTNIGSNQTAAVQTESTVNGLGFFTAYNQNNAYGTVLALAKSRGTTVGSNTIVQSGDQIGGVFFYGADGVDTAVAGGIECYVDGTPGANDMPGRLVFSTTADGAASPTERLRITSAGLVGIGTSAPIYLLHTQVSNNTAYTSTSASLLVPANTLHFVANADNTTANTGAFTAWAASGTGFSSVWYAGVDGGTGSYTGPFVIGRRTGSISYEEVLRIDSSGRVGIGTTSPSQDLDLRSTDTTAVFQIASGVASTTSTSTIQLVAFSSASAVAGTARINGTAPAGGQSELSFLTSPSGNAPQERARIDSSGRLLVGTSSARAVGGNIVGNLYVENNSVTQVVVVNNENSATGPSLRLGKTRGTTTGSNTIVQNNDILGLIQFAGADGTDLVSSGANIRAEVDGTPGVDDMPGRLVFGTTADGASSPTERMRITSTGAVGIGTNSPSEALHVAGNVLVKASGAPSTLTVGTGAEVGPHVVNVLGGGSGVDYGYSLGGSLRLYTNTSNSAQTKLAAGNESIIFANGATPTERARIDSSGRLLVGTSASITTSLSGASQIQLGTTGAYGISAYNFTNDVNGCVLNLGKSRNTSVGSHTVVVNGDALGYIRFDGSDGSKFVLGAGITAEVDGAPGLNDMPGRLVFSTTADGASSPTEAMRINNQRELLIGTTTRTANGGVLQVSNGITFPGTQSACSNPNTLDDYEEGTFTPTIVGTSTAGTGTYTTQVGRYVKIGKQVFFQISLVWTAHTGTGNMRVAGLPFTAVNTADAQSAVSIAPSNLTFSNTLSAFTVNNASQIYLRTYATNAAEADLPINTAATLRVCGVYEAV